MTSQDDRELDGYLWDPAAAPSAGVRVVESRVAPLRFDPARRPLSLPQSPRAGRRASRTRWLALAASIAIVACAASLYWFWRWSWPSGAPWPVTIARAAASTSNQRAELQIDRPLQLDATATAEIGIARIGTMQVAPGSALTMTETTSRRHRVLLDRGAVSVRVWAPPGRFAFATPAGSVIDLGCVFDLSVAADGTSRVTVKTGWVQMANGWGESLIPAGASSVMTAAARPGVPIYDDAAPALSAGVRSIERDLTSPALTTTDAVLAAARPRDTLTLLMLAVASPASSTSARAPLVRRAAQLVPPPSTVSLDAIIAGDDDALWRWYGTLDLPPAKSWWLNWRDALPWLR